MTQNQPVPERKRSDRILDATEIGLWLLLLGIGGMVAFEAMRQRALEIAGPEIEYPAGFVEAEQLRVRGTTHGIRLWVQPTTAFAGGQWSSDGHLFAMDAELGSWVELELPVLEAGPHQVELFLTRARDYGVLQASIDGAPVGEPIDLWARRGVLPTGAIELGHRELSLDSVLRLEVVGTNERSAPPHHQFGIDGVELTPVPEGGPERATPPPQ
jgi:hypothetical protein